MIVHPEFFPNEVQRIQILDHRQSPSSSFIDEGRRFPVGMGPGSAMERPEFVIAAGFLVEDRTLVNGVRALGRFRRNRRGAVNGENEDSGDKGGERLGVGHDSGRH